MTTREKSSDSVIVWECQTFAELAPADLYAAMQLRQVVFIVEQKCVYLDADNSDQRASHLFAWKTGSDWRRLVAYARLFPPRVKYAEASIGRVSTHPDERGTGLGKSLMAKAIEEVAAAGWGNEIRIAAQMYLESFYEGFGFKRVTEPYLEDDIWHVDMRRG
jgi:ElaA protein